MYNTMLVTHLKDEYKRLKISYQRKKIELIKNKIEFDETKMRIKMRFSFLSSFNWVGAWLLVKVEYSGKAIQCKNHFYAILCNILHDLGGLHNLTSNDRSNIDRKYIVTVLFCYIHHYSKQLPKTNGYP
ncbi:hypothetical protein BpHYR1_025083 [Brachionus plicatilis]|uniref:Uncharacterized protein n=1 Tax=Brachionus plicatilis TaxID=10195 RepID=A0A3M7RGS2_BRAPC|nr:hypothetical protein BpHYR1_025083 [Brachionus plicatilis]